MSNKLRSKARGRKTSKKQQAYITLIHQKDEQGNETWTVCPDITMAIYCLDPLHVYHKH